jgi:hypothetical protein
MLTRRALLTMMGGAFAALAIPAGGGSPVRQVTAAEALFADDLQAWLPEDVIHRALHFDDFEVVLSSRRAGAMEAIYDVTMGTMGAMGANVPRKVGLVELARPGDLCVLGAGIAPLCSYRWVAAPGGEIYFGPGADLDIRFQREVRVTRLSRVEPLRLEP